MNDLSIKGYACSPTVYFNDQTGELTLDGEYYQEYDVAFFKPVYDWLDGYLRKKGRKITVNLKLSHLNSSARRRIDQILECLQDYHTSHKGKVMVKWFYFDTDTKEEGIELAETFNNLPIHVLPV
ncbi:DUF1987 domain-containing protein [Microscilla marina]|uniref:SiaC family regulatory phosphoprotein domain-containing protein n=1 Tax=Microscilla marina ATCC 23134 TaxID=313606 RepID=A1ZKI4_MICM2|nr:DUF1987 domain-containing protein [Microscilla marina]EAY29210.1 conserved hypothetical protein [Microscilla marina ATCC 23134]